MRLERKAALATLTAPASDERSLEDATELVCANPEHHDAAVCRAWMRKRDQCWPGRHGSIPAHDYCIVPEDEDAPALINGRRAFCPFGASAPGHVWIEATRPGRKTARSSR